jgi:hypothetical protein
MGVRELLQEALVGTNTVRHSTLSIVQSYDSQLMSLKVSVQRAESEKASMVGVRDFAEKNYRELFDYSNGLADQDVRSALAPEIERLAGELNTASRRVQVAGQALREAQKRKEELERDRAVAQWNATLASERWERSANSLTKRVLNSDLISRRSWDASIIG